MMAYLEPSKYVGHLKDDEHVMVTDDRKVYICRYFGFLREDDHLAVVNQGIYTVKIQR
jgi:hypothetical protein